VAGEGVVALFGRGSRGSGGCADGNTVQDDLRPWDDKLGRGGVQTARRRAETGAERGLEGVGGGEELGTGGLWPSDDDQVARVRPSRKL
jgi:hypothetical protein